MFEPIKKFHFSYHKEAEKEGKRFCRVIARYFGLPLDIVELMFDESKKLIYTGTPLSNEKELFHETIRVIRDLYIYEVNRDIDKHRNILGIYILVNTPAYFFGYLSATWSKK